MNQTKLPNATVVLILGILSIVGCCCTGLISLATGGIGLFLAKKDERLYLANPAQYLDYNNLKTGKILCIIGLVMGVIYLIYMLWIGSTLGWDALANPQLMQERMKDLMEGMQK